MTTWEKIKAALTLARQSAALILAVFGLFGAIWLCAVSIGWGEAQALGIIDWIFR